MTTREEADRAELEEMAFEAWWKAEGESTVFSRAAARAGWTACAAQFKPIGGNPKGGSEAK